MSVQEVQLEDASVQYVQLEDDPPALLESLEELEDEVGLVGTSGQRVQPRLRTLYGSFSWN